MTKLLIAISFLFLLGIPFANSSEFIFNCTNRESNFMTNYKVNTSERTILHTTSKDLDTNKKHIVNEKLWIIKFLYPKAITWIRDSKDFLGEDLLNFNVFDFEKETVSHSGHFSYRKPSSHFYNCLTTHMD